ncbi:hypothetical protein DZJ_24230 [Dickeya ananatis]
MVSASVSPFFTERGVAAVGKTNHRSAQAVDGGFKRQTGAGRSLKETAGDHFVLEQFRLGMGFQAGRHLERQFQIVPAEIVD